MKLTLLFLLSSAILCLAEPLPEIPAGPIEKVRYWAILEQRWRIIEPQLFTAEGAQYIGTPVRFDATTVSVGKPVVVRTSSGATARVSNVPKADMGLIHEFRGIPPHMTVLGTITAIDPATHTISIRGGELRPWK